ncbi:hypothetical protein FRX31_007119, partial [Thalictrum thalictroides]
MASSKEVSASSIFTDKYRTYMNEDEVKNTQWRHGGPPIYDSVNKLFDQERTK